MPRPAVTAGNALSAQASRLPGWTRLLSLLALVVLAVCGGPVAAGSALSPAAGSTGFAASTPSSVAALRSLDPQRLPHDYERGSELFGKRRIARDGDRLAHLAPMAPVDVAPLRMARPALAPGRAPAWTHGTGNEPPPRDHRRLLTERYPPQAPPLA